MPRLKLLVDASPVRLIRRLLGQRDHRETWPAIRDILLESFRRNFESLGHGAWPKLSAETLKWRRAIEAEGRPILNISGRLRDSVIETKGAGHVEIIRRETMDVGSSLGSSGLHQFGGEVTQPLRTRKARKAFGVGGPGHSLIKRIPARPFLTAGGTPSDPTLDDETGFRVAETFAESLGHRIYQIFGVADVR